MTDTLVIPSWANGPDGSGNGGWSAGLLARHVTDADEGIAVNLRVPPPIGRELQVVHTPDGVELRDGDVLVADAAPTHVEPFVPDAVRAIDPDVAHAASVGFPFRDRHPFPRCLVCGVTRGGDEPAFHLHCGPVVGLAAHGTEVFADRWDPEAALADPDDPEHVRVEACWAALDCPSAAPVADPDGAPIVLARIAARIDVSALPRIGEPCVAASRHVASDGRKHRTRSALIGPDRRVVGVADALWIEVRPT